MGLSITEIQLFSRVAEKQKEETCPRWEDKFQLWTPTSELKMLPGLMHHYDLMPIWRPARDLRSCLSAQCRRKLIDAPKLFLREEDHPALLRQSPNLDIRAMSESWYSPLITSCLSITHGHMHGKAQAEATQLGLEQSSHMAANLCQTT